MPASRGWRCSRATRSLIAFGLAVIVIYLVLAAQFESFRDPFIIMMSVPLSIFGAHACRSTSGSATLNIYTQVGLITLIGLITKHGILMVEFANQQREEHGLRRREAIIAAAKVRLRPILMTTAAMVLGVVPLIIAERRRRRGALLDGPGDRRRHVDRHALHAVRGADVLHPHRPRPALRGADGDGGRRGGRAQAGAGRGVGLGSTLSVIPGGAKRREGIQG